MNDLLKDMVVLLLRELDAFQREIEMFPDDESVWRTVPGVRNSAGNLALHICGNLQHFVGAVLGGSSYVRDRELEFRRRSGTRSELVSALKAASNSVQEVLPRVSDAQLGSEFPDAPMGARINTRLFLMHLCTHAAFHLGQAGYVRRIVTGESRSSRALPIEPLMQV
jgi:hypothetical protein